MSDEPIIKRAGFAAILGAPNAGKSTLVNRLVGTKVAIVTHKVQTTRFQVRGIAHHGEAQIVLIDTPGIFSARTRLDRAMVQSAWAGADDADARVHLVDASAWVTSAPSPAQRKSIEDDLRVIETLKERGLTVFLALNKIDQFAHSEILPVIAKLNETGVYSEIFPISAVNGDGVEALADALAAAMPEGGALYPPDQAADIPTRLLAAEMTREKLMLRLHQELPYQLTVETESWEERQDGSARIDQVIYVMRDGHKGIVLGRKGETVKAIGQAARTELEEFLGRKVHLFLQVKVRENWLEEAERYSEMGLDFKDGN